MLTGVLRHPPVLVQVRKDLNACQILLRSLFPILSCCGCSVLVPFPSKKSFEIHDGIINRKNLNDQTQCDIQKAVDFNWSTWALLVIFLGYLF